MPELTRLTKALCRSNRCKGVPSRDRPPWGNCSAQHGKVGNAITSVALIRHSSKSAGFVRLFSRSRFQNKTISSDVRALPRQTLTSSFQALAQVNVSVPGYDDRAGYTMTALNRAIGCRDATLVNSVLKPEDWNVRGFHGNTPVHIAARAGRAEFLQAILEFGADGNARNSLGLYCIPHLLTVGRHRSDSVACQCFLRV